jgi:hypothetical protein
MKQKLQGGVYPTTGDAFLDMFGMLSTSPPLHSFGAPLNHGWNLLLPPVGVAIQIIRDVPCMWPWLCCCMRPCNIRSRSTLQTKTGCQVLPARLHPLPKDFAAGGILGGVGSWVTTAMGVVVRHHVLCFQVFRASVEYPSHSTAVVRLLSICHSKIRKSSVANRHCECLRRACSKMYNGNVP